MVSSVAMPGHMIGVGARRQLVCVAGMVNAGRMCGVLRGGFSKVNACFHWGWAIFATSVSRRYYVGIASVDGSVLGVLPLGWGAGVKNA